MEPGEGRIIMLFGALGGFSIATFVGVLTLVLATVGLDDATVSAQGSDAVQLLTGERIYVAQCASCHGIQGEGGIGTRLGGGAVVENYADIEAQISVITNGRRNMPQFGSSLTASEIESVARYERERLGR